MFKKQQIFSGPVEKKKMLIFLIIQILFACPSGKQILSHNYIKVDPNSMLTQCKFDYN
jgi:hypothetical protein